MTSDQIVTSNSNFDFKFIFWPKIQIVTQNLNFDLKSEFELQKDKFHLQMASLTLHRKIDKKFQV